MTRSRYKFIENEQPYFLTSTIVGWFPLFTDPSIVEFALCSLRFLQQENRLNIFAYVIMEHHLHLVASSDDLSKEIGDFKSYTVRRIIDYLEAINSRFRLQQLRLRKLQHKRDRTNQVWQEGSHPEVIQGKHMMRQKIAYIHNNPVRKGYVDDPCDWRFSSARNYAGQVGLLDVITDWF